MSVIGPAEEAKWMVIFTIRPLMVFSVCITGEVFLTWGAKNPITEALRFFIFKKQLSTFSEHTNSVLQREKTPVKTQLL